MNPKALQRYLAKLAITHQLQVCTNDLFTLHQAQLFRIAFENFDVMANQPLRLDVEGLLNKLIDQQRGGYCFELNGLLLSALQSLGFNARPLLGRVHLSETPSGRTHQVTLVTLNDQEWLVDAGFGSNTPRQPLPITLNKTINTDCQQFRFIQTDQFGLMLETGDKNGWKPLYSLDLSYVFKGDIECANHFTATHVNSVFTANFVACRNTPDGIITLLNQRLKIRSSNDEYEQVLHTKEAYLAALKRYFFIELEQKIAAPIASMGITETPLRKGN